jgi:hypothetical protein
VEAAYAGKINVSSVDDVVGLRHSRDSMSTFPQRRHIIMPLVSVLLPGQQSYLEWKAVIHGKEIPYGLFLGEVVNFLLIAVVIFLFIVKFLGWLMKTKESMEKLGLMPPGVLPEAGDLGTIV